MEIINFLFSDTKEIIIEKILFILKNIASLSYNRNIIYYNLRMENKWINRLRATNFFSEKIKKREKENSLFRKRELKEKNSGNLKKFYRGASSHRCAVSQVERVCV